MRYPEYDLRPWLEQNAATVNTYTMQRINQSYSFVEELLARCPGIQGGAAYDMGSGAGFNSFALGAYFNKVVAVDALEEPILEARKIAESTGTKNIVFECADVEGFQPNIEFDLVLCNLMSHNVSSRSTLAQTMTNLIKSGGWLFYSEIAEGYSPLEIHRSILQRNQAELISRLQQVIRGFTGAQGFRFFASGTIQKPFEHLGLSIRAIEANMWNGLPISEQLLCQRSNDDTDIPEFAVANGDYWELPPDFKETRLLFNEFLLTRSPTGFTMVQKSRLQDLAKGTTNKYAPYFLYLLMLDAVLGKLPWVLRRALPSSLTRPELKGFALLTKTGTKLSEADWSALAELDRSFIVSSRYIAGLNSEPIDD